MLILFMITGSLSGTGSWDVKSPETASPAAGGPPQGRVDRSRCSPVAIPRGDIRHVLRPVKCRMDLRGRLSSAAVRPSLLVAVSPGSACATPRGDRPTSRGRSARLRPESVQFMRAARGRSAWRCARRAVSRGQWGRSRPREEPRIGPSRPPRTAEAALTPAADQGAGRAILNREHSSIYSRGPRGQFSRDPRDGLLAPQRRDRRARRPRQDHSGRRHAPRQSGAFAERAEPRRPGHGLRRPGARKGHHDPREEHGDPLATA